MSPGITILPYQSLRDYDMLHGIILNEGEEWESYLEPKYKEALEQSICHVAYQGEQLCGYCRSIDDSGLYILVMDLLIHPDYRGQDIGRKLMEQVCAAYPEQETLVLSDVDEYYRKQGYTKEGSVFKVG